MHIPVGMPRDKVENWKFGEDASWELLLLLLLFLPCLRLHCNYCYWANQYWSMTTAMIIMLALMWTLGGSTLRGWSPPNNRLNRKGRVGNGGLITIFECLRMLLSQQYSRTQVNKGQLHWYMGKGSNQGVIFQSKSQQCIAYQIRERCRTVDCSKAIGNGHNFT